MKKRLSILTGLLLPLSLLAFRTDNKDFSGLIANEDPQIADLLIEAEQGDAGAQYLRGYMDAEGVGIFQDPIKAIRWYTRAAEQGQSAAQLLLSDLLVRSQGNQADLVETYKWSFLAEHSGQDVSESQCRMTERMTSEQIAEAQQRAGDLFLRFAETSVESGPILYVSKIDEFSIRFPSPPRRTVVQDNARLSAVHYQSFSANNRIQYNVSLQ
ncbi:MAG TPA: hypothetical protein PLP49_10630 [Anaerohalosphaeraceae bacterium]|mgnify:CR=1 FL=1|nr:hypothetical protein [Anaerohalosphaeraceae bacterium]